MKNGILGCCILLLASGCNEGIEPSEENVAEGHEHFRTLWFGVDHNDITEDGLHFLSDDVADEVGDYNEDTDSGDTRYQSKYHVDNCRIQEAFDGVRQRYATAVTALDPARPQAKQAKKMFGMIAHTVQDFYAHSNWVEGGQTRLFDSDGMSFPSVATGRMLGGMMVITETLPAAYRITLASGSRVPTVRPTGSSTTYKGLITGTFEDNDDRSICPGAASIEHGSDLFQGSYGSFLAKDDPDSPHHAAAVSLAVRQTTEEFCRLARLVMLRYGNRGLDSMLGIFEADRAGYEAACPRNRSLVAAAGGSI